MPQEVLNIIWSALGVLVTGLLSWVTTVLINWLNSKIKDAKLRKWTVDLSQIIMTSVKTISQTYVESLKKENAFTKEAQKEAFARCLELIKAQLTPELKAYIEKNFGDMEAYLKAQIESMVSNLK